MSDTTSYYRCTKCKLQTDPIVPLSNPTGGSTERGEMVSICCLAPVQVVSDKRP